MKMMFSLLLSQDPSEPLLESDSISLILLDIISLFLNSFKFLLKPLIHLLLKKFTYWLKMESDVLGQPMNRPVGIIRYSNMLILMFKLKMLRLVMSSVEFLSSFLLVNLEVRQLLLLPLTNKDLPISLNLLSIIIMLVSKEMILTCHPIRYCWCKKTMLLMLLCGYMIRSLNQWFLNRTLEMHKELIKISLYKLDLKMELNVLLIL